MDVGAKGIDVYNTILDGMDVPTRLGPKERERGRLIRFARSEFESCRGVACGDRRSDI